MAGLPDELLLLAGPGTESPDRAPTAAVDDAFGLGMARLGFRGLGFRV